MTGPFFRHARRGIAICLLSGAAPALAHDADVIFVEARDEGNGVIEERVTLTANTLADLAPVDSDRDGLITAEELQRALPAIAAGVWDDMPLLAAGVRCSRLESRAKLAEGFVELRAKFSCGPGELSQTFKLLLVLPQNYRVVVGTQEDGERDRQSFARPLISGAIPRSGGANVSRAFAAAWAEGVGRAFVWPWLLLLAGWALVEGSARRVVLLFLTCVSAGAVGATASGLWAASSTLGVGVGLGLFGLGLLVRKAAAARGLLVAASLALSVAPGGPFASALGSWGGMCVALAVGAVPLWAVARWGLTAPRLVQARRLAAGAFLMAAGFEVAKLFRA